MAAYGALLSLTNTIDQILNHPRPPISLHKLKIQPLIQMVSLLMHFLENYIICDPDGLEGRMIDAAHEAEDIIESYIADRIDSRGEASISSNDDNESLYRELEKVMHDLDSITKDVVAVKDKAWKKIAPSCTEDDAMVGSDDVMNNIMVKVNSSPYSEGDDTMVDSDVMYDILDKLTNPQSGRRIIAIAGMGGIGKTTLAKRIYEHPLIVEQFDIHGWATVSQEFDSKRILLEVLDCLNKTMGSEDEDSEYEEFGQILYQRLYGRRYLIVMDDIWGTDAWDCVKRFFPDNKDGSRVLITTRLSNVALQLDGLDYFQMSFLNPEESWKLLRKCIFGEQGCPPELEEIGKEISRNCRGLPLSVVVIGGLLAKSQQTWQNWQHVAENLSSIVNLENDESCFRTLEFSYRQLPVHLKPCFLYMGIYPEDQLIRISVLIRLWIDEGFVKAVAGKSLEEVARANLNDLVLRNLIMVLRDHTRRIKWCAIHDLVRDLCIKEADKYKFLCRMHNPGHDQRCIGIHQATSEYIPRPLLPVAVQFPSRLRTLIWNVDGGLPSPIPFRLLRVLHASTEMPLNRDEVLTGPLVEFFHPINLRHLVTTTATLLRVPEFPPELYRLWNLRMLILELSDGKENETVLDIWRMPQLRKVKVGDLRLTDPPPLPMDETENGDRMVLEKLETLKTVLNLKLGEELVERIPNIKKLGIRYDNNEMELSPADCKGLVNNVCRLRKLEALSLNSFLSQRIEVTSFPISLRKLRLDGTRLGWEEMGTKIGSLPYLEGLDLCYDAFVGPEWETTEGGFPSLKYLCCKVISDLEQWRSDATHFPRLERLKLWDMKKLKEIPLRIGDIDTLRYIKVKDCPDSVVLSAKNIIEEQEECFGEVGLEIEVWLNDNINTQLLRENLRSRRNFEVY